MTTEKALKMILQTQICLLDLMNEGVLSKETVNLYLDLLNKKYSEFKNKTNESNRTMA